MNTIRIIFILTVSFLVGCASNVTAPISVAYGDRETLYFTGRGSAAGMMMDAYMGGAGIAIGIAIDEGIAKDITAALLLSNPKFSMPALVQDVLREQSKKSMSIRGIKSIVIEKYGFQSAPGDKVSPLLELQFVCASGLSQKVVSTLDENTQLMTFEQSKKDGVQVEKQLRDSAWNVLKKYNQSCNP